MPSRPSSSCARSSGAGATATKTAPTDKKASPERMEGRRTLALITTGGTIEKTYDEQTGELVNRRSIVRRMLSELRLEETEVTVLELLSKDSLDMTEADRDRIIDA